MLTLTGCPLVGWQLQDRKQHASRHSLPSPLRLFYMSMCTQQPSWAKCQLTKLPVPLLTQVCHIDLHIQLSRLLGSGCLKVQIMLSHNQTSTSVSLNPPSPPHLPVAVACHP